MLRGSRTRLTAVLVRLAGLREEHPPDPPIIDATQGEIASVANLSRSVVSELLLEMEHDGCIHLKRAALQVLDSKRLRQLAEPR